MQNGSSGDSCFLHFVNSTWDRGSPIYCTHSLLTSETASMWYCILTFKCGMVLTICTTYYVVLIIDTQRQRCKTCWVFHVTSFQSIVWVAKSKKASKQKWVCWNGARDICETLFCGFCPVKGGGRCWPNWQLFLWVESSGPSFADSICSIFSKDV